MAAPADYIFEGTPNTIYNYYDYPIETNWCDMNDVSAVSALFTSILYSLIFFLSLLGNSLVLWIVIKYESLRSSTNLFIVNLCITDLAFSCTLPFWILYGYNGWTFGGFLCKTVSAIFSISYYGGVIFLTIMTILRYLAVVDPLSTLRTWKKEYSILVSSAIWISTILVVVPKMVFIQVTSDMNSTNANQHCDYKQHYWKLVELCLQLVFFIVSFMIFAICYIKMIKILLRSRSQRRQKTVRLIFTIVVVFFLSWAPYNVLGFVYELSFQHYITLNCQRRKEVFFAFDISRIVAYCHCCLNPVLYVFVGVKFRKHLKLLYRQYSQCQSRIPPVSPRIHSSHIGPYEEASLY